MRRTTLTFAAATAVTALAFAPIADAGWTGPSAERLADPLAHLDGASLADDLPGPGDLVHSVENIPGGVQGTLDEGVDSVEGFDPSPVFSFDVISLSGTRHPSIPARDGHPDGGVVRGGAAGDLGTFVEFFSPTVADPATGEDVTIDIAVQGVNDMGALLWDVTNPAAPELLSILNCGYHQADVGAYQLDDGRWIVALGADDVGDHENCLSSPVSPYFQAGQPAAGSGDEVMAFFDVTDPRQPVALSSVATQETATGGSHTIEMQPNAPIAYIVTALDPRLEIVDFSVPEKPTIVGTLDTPGNPHAFRISDDGTRGYSAGSFMQTLSVHDTSDPYNPIPIGVSAAPRNLYTHEALPAHDKSFVLVLDEGAYDPGYNSGYCPGTGFWLYDLTVENSPVPLSYTVADADHQTAQGQGCASHYGNISYDNTLFTMAYYGAGVRVFDLSDTLDPVEVGHMMFSDSDVWTAKSYKDGEYVFVSDLNRGFEVYRWTGEGSLADKAPEQG